MMGLFWWILQKRIWNKYEWIYNIGGTRSLDYGMYGIWNIIYWILNMD